MKKTKFIIYALIAIITTSCSIQKRQYNKGYYVEWKTNKSKNQQKLNARPEFEEILNKKIDTDQQELFAMRNTSNKQKAEFEHNGINLNLKEKNNFVLNEDCDLIILKTGEEIKARVLEIGLNEIKYKKCDNPNGPTISISKSDVFMIKYPNGTKDIITIIKQEQIQEQKSNTNSQNPKKMNGFAVAGFILSLVGWPIVYSISIAGGVAVLILSIIFSIIALAYISRHRDKSNGTGLAIAGLIIGILTLFATLVILGTIL